MTSAHRKSAFFAQDSSSSFIVHYWAYYFSHSRLFVSDYCTNTSFVSLPLCLQHIQTHIQGTLRQRSRRTELRDHAAHRSGGVGSIIRRIGARSRARRTIISVNHAGHCRLHLRMGGIAFQTATVAGHASVRYRCSQSRMVLHDWNLRRRGPNNQVSAALAGQ